MSRKRKKRRRTGLRMIAIMVLFVCGIVIYKRMDLKKEYDKKMLKKESLSMDIENATLEEEELKEKKAYMQTKKFIEDVARDVLGLVYEDEIIFKQSE